MHAFLPNIFSDIFSLIHVTDRIHTAMICIFKRVCISFEDMLEGCYIMPKGGLEMHNIDWFYFSLDFTKLGTS